MLQGKKMNSLCEFYRLQGHKIIKTDSCYWFNASKFFYQAIPYHCAVNPSNNELKKLFFNKLVIGVRYFTATSSPLGKESFIWICDDKDYNLSKIKQKARNQTRRGLERCKIEKVDFDYLKRHGIGLVRDTLIRQGRNVRSINEKKWENLCNAAGKLSDFEAWAAFTRGKLAAFIIGFKIGELFYILHHYSKTECLRTYPNNALIYLLTKEKLSQPYISQVSYGIQSLDSGISKLHKFKENMGFKKNSIRQVIIFNPFLKPFMGKPICKMISKICKLNNKSDFFRKLDGILYFYMGDKSRK